MEDLLALTLKMARHPENGNENDQVQSTWAPISPVDLLTKQVLYNNLL